MTTSIIKASKFFKVKCPLSITKCEFRLNQKLQNITDTTVLKTNVNIAQHK